MQVVAHDRIGVNRDGEALGDEVDALRDPVLAVLEGPTAVAIDAAEERSPDAALDAVEGAGAVERGDVGGGAGSWPSVAETRSVKCRGITDEAVREI